MLLMLIRNGHNKLDNELFQYMFIYILSIRYFEIVYNIQTIYIVNNIKTCEDAVRYIQLPSVIIIILYSKRYKQDFKHQFDMSFLFCCTGNLILFMHKNGAYVHRAWMKTYPTTNS